MKNTKYTVTGKATVSPRLDRDGKKADLGEMEISVWAGVGPRGRIVEVRGYNTVTWDDGRTQTGHGDIFTASEWSNFCLADLDPDRAGDNAQAPLQGAAGACCAKHVRRWRLCGIRCGSALLGERRGEPTRPAAHAHLKLFRPPLTIVRVGSTTWFSFSSYEHRKQKNHPF